MRKLLLLFLFPLAAGAQTDIQSGFHLFKKYPFPTELTASATGARIAWAMNQEGRRNIYVAEGPAFTPRKLTNYTMDDGQEITSLQISDDGQWVVFVRGGDHGANWDDDLPVDPGFGTEPFKVQVGVAAFSGGPVRYISEGDEPLVSPDSKRVVFIKNGQVWMAGVDSGGLGVGSGAAVAGTAEGITAAGGHSTAEATGAKNLFTTRGNVGSLQWSPDGKRLLFVAGRGDHSIIGIYTMGSSMLKWIAPSFSRNESPQWSGDGSKIVWVRRPGSGGAPDSLLANKPVPWSIYMADTAGGMPMLLYKAPATLRGSYPQTDGGVNLHWAAGSRIVFVSYEDGWPHLYSLDVAGIAAGSSGASGSSGSSGSSGYSGYSGSSGSSGGTVLAGRPVLLTPGKFMCEQIGISADKRFMLFSANTGDDPDDLERRHVAVVSVDKPDMRVMTPGKGLEWTPALTGDGKTLVFLSATAQRPPLPAVMAMGGRDLRVLGADLIPADFPQAALVTPRSVVFTAADGVVVHADLFQPSGGEAGVTSADNAGTTAGGNAGTTAGGSNGRRPAIVYVHGGPPRQMLLGWHYSDYYSNAYAANQYLASLGFVVLSVNYRLGIGYGYEFHHPKHGGAAGAAEYKDIRAAGEWLRRQGFVDTARIGIYGGSYGGYLTALALARDSKIFGAGVDFHGVHDWLNATSLATLYKDRYEKAPDYELALKTAWQSSPVSAIAGWKSPVLIIQGDDDRNVRFNQSVDLVNRLEKRGVPFESMVIVDDTHHWMRFSNAVTVYGAAADFFVRKFMQAGRP